MQRNIVALLHDPWPRAYAESGSLWRRAVSRFRRALFSRANPRNEAYMLALLRERWGELAPTRVGVPGWEERVARADLILLLYPDAIGQGFGNVERTVARRKQATAEVRVLNGRRREFALSPATRRRLRARRVLERTMLAEFLFLALFMIATPGLLIVDLMRGRR